jgi:4'-phosphopantetheinyl transferase
VFLVSIVSELKIEIKEWNNTSRKQAVPSLHEGEVQIWHWPLHASPQEVKDLRELLSEDERERVEGYRFDKHRNEFILTRSTLRILLSSHVGTRPEKLRFAYSALGKPALDDSLTDLRFSVSHTDGRAILALVKGREVGADVERVRPEPDAQKLAKRFFSAREGLFLEKLSGHELVDAFFRCWTLKEAYVKAKGGGLSIPLHDFDVSLVNDCPSALLQTRPDAGEAERWTLHSLTIVPGYAAALAVANTEDESAR